MASLDTNLNKRIYWLKEQTMVQLCNVYSHKSEFMKWSKLSYASNFCCDPDHIAMATKRARTKLIKLNFETILYCALCNVHLQNVGYCVQF